MAFRIEYPGRYPVYRTITELVVDGWDRRSWYEESKASIEAYAEAHGICPGYVADVLAILSPRVAVSRNVKMAQAYLEDGRILRGTMKARVAALHKYEATGRLAGPKVVAFSKALRGDRDACVVDVWIFRAFGMTSTHHANYRKAEGKVVRASRRLRCTVVETQASIWVGTKRACGFNEVSPIDMER